MSACDKHSDKTLVFLHGVAVANLERTLVWNGCRYPVYEEGGRIVYIRPGMEEAIFGKKEAAPEAAGEAELKITLSQ